MHTSMSTTLDEHGACRRMPARPADTNRGSAFARRIRGGGRASSSSTPARGGGMRDPEAWERRRDPRR
jgi:hypothetical protein